jgi:exosortase/archaeosortase family protein
MNLFKRSKDLIKRKKLQPLIDVFIFIMVTVVIHFSYRYWANQLHYFPINEFISKTHAYLSGRVFIESSWIVQNMLGMEVSVSDKTIFWANQGYIKITYGCSGLKQMIQFSLLMLVFPGPWKHKLWFIPLGILIVHITNLFRIVGLGVVIVTIPDYWDFSHDYVFRPFFYVVIFGLWIFWVEKIKNK